MTDANSSPRIMVVDDSASVRRFVTYALRASGLDVVTASDGQQALEKMSQTSIDLLITDLNMPRLDGYSLVDTLRNEEQDDTLPIIILSSLSDRDAIDRGLDLGANAYLKKPFDEERVRDEVERHLG